MRGLQGPLHSPAEQLHGGGELALVRATVFFSPGDKAASDAGEEGRRVGDGREFTVPSHLTSCTSEGDTRLVTGKEKKTGLPGPPSPTAEQ